MDLDALLAAALASGDDAPLRAALVEGSGLPGARLDLRLVWRFAGAVGAVVAGHDPPTSPLETLLDGWAAIPAHDAPGDQPAVILPCAAVAAYGEVGAVRPEWIDDELAKLGAAATDSRWRVRELVSQALQRQLSAHWSTVAGALRAWAAADDPLVVRAAVAGVAEPMLLRVGERVADALAIQQIGVEQYRSLSAAGRKTDGAKALRKALGFTISVAAAAAHDASLAVELSGSTDTDLRWIGRENLKKARLRRMLHPNTTAAP